jgi:hypothetical protein
VRADRVTFRVDPARGGGIGASHFADEEECRLDALGGEDVENRVGVAGHGTVIKGEDDFLVGKGQICGVIHAAHARIFARIDSKHAARSERIEISRTILRARRDGAKSHA